MKRKLRLQLLMTIIICLVMSCTATAKSSPSDIFKSGLKKYQAKSYISAQQEFDRLPKKANEKCVKKMTAKMKSAYKKNVKSYGKNLKAYFLTDIDKNGKAELIVEHGTCEADMRLSVYKFVSGKSKKICTTGCGHITLYQNPFGNGFYLLSQHMLGETLVLYGLSYNNVSSWYHSYRYLEVIYGEDYIHFPYELDDHVTASGKITYKDLT